MTRTEKALTMRVTRLEAQLRRFENAAYTMNGWCEGPGEELLDMYERIRFAISMGAVVHPPPPITTGRDLEVAKIEYDLGLPGVDREAS